MKRPRSVAAALFDAWCESHGELGAAACATAGEHVARATFGHLSSMFAEVGPSLELAAWVGRQLDASLATIAEHHACKPGCAACCAHPIGVSPLEALLIASAIVDQCDDDTRREIGAALMEREAYLDSIPPMDEAAYRMQRMACVFLGPDDRCQAYDVRPFVCRIHNSLDAAACARALVKPRTEVPTNDGAIAFGAAVVAGALAVLHSHGLDCDLYDMGSALLRALHDPPGILVAWGNGQDAFAGVRRAYGAPPPSFRPLGLG